MKFVTIPEYVDAEQFFPEENKPLPIGVIFDNGEFWFDTPHDSYQIYTGDWIITNESGYQWAWTPETFEKRYKKDTS